jgi:hypothetical protein
LACILWASRQSGSGGRARAQALGPRQARAHAPGNPAHSAYRAQGAGAVGQDRPYTHRQDGQNDQVPLRPRQRANLTGPLCMGARVDARTTPYKMGPPPAGSGPGNVCTHDCGPVEVGGSMWKARARSPLVAWEPSRRPFLPCQAGCLSVTGGAQVPSVGPRFRNGGSRPSQPWFLLSSGRRKRPWSGRPGCQRCSECPAMGAPVTPETCRYGRPARGRTCRA